MKKSRQIHSDALGDINGNFPVDHCAVAGEADYLFWFHFADGSFMPSAMFDMIVTMMGGSDNVMLKGLQNGLENAYKLAEAQLAKTNYIASDEFTVADIIMVFPLTTMRLFSPHDISAYPNIHAYLERISQRPALQRAIQKADPWFQLPIS